MIKHPFLAVISGLLLVVVLGFVVERKLFLMRAEKTVGSVQRIEARSARCGGGRRRRSYPCTKYSAVVEFKTSSGATSTLSVSAGRTRGSNMAVTNASRRVGGAVPVIYDPGNPSKAYENTIWGVWGTPIMVLGAQLASGIASMSESKRRRFPGRERHTV